MIRGVVILTTTFSIPFEQQLFAVGQATLTARGGWCS
jgi:hypothetical protein